jgi:hypothetical protein
MLKLCAGKLLDDFNMIGAVAQTLVIQQKQGRGTILPRAVVSELRDKASSLADQCAELGLSVSAGAASDLVHWVEKILEAEEDAPVSPEIMARVQGYLREVQTTLRRETESRLFLMIQAEHQRFYKPSGFLFSPEVDVAFEGIRFDSSEAGKCIALERSTAAVYHLVRCLEAGLRAIARCLDIADPTSGYGRGWGAILKDIDGEIKKRWPHAANRMSGDGQFFESLYASLAAIKAPYRDSTMHLQEKYTEEEARYVFEMVKGLMTKIADRMDETGNPKCL